MSTQPFEKRSEDTEDYLVSDWVQPTVYILPPAMQYCSCMAQVIYRECRENRANNKSSTELRGHFDYSIFISCLVILFIFIFIFSL